MKAIFKRDFKAYFSSPLGYVFVAAFCLVMNIYFFLNNIYVAANNLEDCFNFMVLLFVFLIPILTMRSFSEDYKQKTDQLLLTAPVSPFGIVFGKFLAAFAVYGVAMIFTLIYPIVISATSTLNFATTIGNYIAIICCAAAFISIGLFISSLTENQLISCVVTLGVFLALYLLDSLYSIINVAWAQYLIYWFSMFRRFDSFSQGIFSFADLIYYITICAVFVFLTIRILEKKRWS